MNGTINKTRESLRFNNFDEKFAESSEDALKMLLDLIPRDATVGHGDSTTVRQIGILDELERRGTKLLNAFTVELTTNKKESVEHEGILRKAITSDIFITGSNAVTMDGKLVNMDATGNRIVGMIFGPKRVFLLVGKNKIVKDFDQAVDRIKNVIAPYHAKRGTPCAITGKCSDCNSPRRICNVMSVHLKKPRRTDVTVIIINEDLGLGWDESWPPERIRLIKSKYDKAREGLFGYSPPARM